MKKVVITAIDRDGFEFHFSHICLGVSDDMDKLDVKKAIEKASTEYCKTEEGQKLYKYNNNSFNYGDFDLYVPNEICEKYGIVKIDSLIKSMGDVDFNEQLVDETELEENIELE